MTKGNNISIAEYKEYIKNGSIRIRRFLGLSKRGNYLSAYNKLDIVSFDKLISNVPYRRRSDPNYKPDYKEYLKTGAWQMKRYYILSKRGRKCEECGETKGPIQVHHLTYKRIYHERLSDFKVLCRDCHEKAHNLNQLDEIIAKCDATPSIAFLDIKDDATSLVPSNEIMLKKKWWLLLWNYLKKLI